MILCMKAPILAIAALLALPTARSENKAIAEWIPELAEVAPGAEFRTVVRLKIDHGWHTYWENPGDAGLPISAEADLPEGWTLSPIKFPAPISFMTGELHGYGYEGEALFPLTITQPEGSRDTKLPEGILAKITWLTCNEESCVPGSAEVGLQAPSPTLIATAYSALPSPFPIQDSYLSVSRKDKNLTVTFTLPHTWSDTSKPKNMDAEPSKIESYGLGIDPSEFTVFPVSQNIISPAAKLQFQKRKTY